MPKVTLQTYLLFRITFSNTLDIVLDKAIGLQLILSDKSPFLFFTDKTIYACLYFGPIVKHCVVP